METTNRQNPKPTKIFHHRLEEEEGEAFSLRHLRPNGEKPRSTTSESHGEPSTELFEFITSNSYDVSPAENIMFGGKLIPLNYKSAIFSPPEHTRPRIRARYKSLSAIQGNELNHPSARDNAILMRTSRSLEYRKLTCDHSTVRSPPENIFPAKKTGKPETTSYGSGKSVNPRWFVIGKVKFPPEIELKDIRSRQIRRNINRRSRSPSPSPPSPSWRFLNALSCKDVTSVAATVPFRVPRA